MQERIKNKENVQNLEYEKEKLAKAAVDLLMIRKHSFR